MLEKVYDPESFRKLGHNLIDQLADLLKENLERKAERVIQWTEPEDEFEFWNQTDRMKPEDFFKLVSERSIKLHHPRYMGHQVSAPAPISALSTLQGSLLNNGMAVYEMGASASALERKVIDVFKPYFGFHDGTGILTSGGTIANLTAMICARNVKSKSKVWDEGTIEKYGFMVSEEAHYCIERAAKIMGWGDDGVIKVPVDSHFKMRIDLLNECYKAAKDKGITVLGVVGSAPSTSTGIYDDLGGIGSFCEEYDLWFHVDAAHGGPAAFSKKYDYLVNGISKADSITVDAHKMMMAPALTTMLFFKNNSDSYKTFAQKAEYLWNANNEEWFNYGKRTLECTKIMLSTRVYSILLCYGIEVFEKYVDDCYDNARVFEELIKDVQNMELAISPESNIVCFRFVEISEAASNLMNLTIRRRMLENGRFYIVQTQIQGKIYLRTSLMNPFTSLVDMKELIIELQHMYKNINL